MKKGISLVALVITIIVLIILTGAVILTSGDTLDQANLAKFRSDITTIQDAVTIKVSDNRIHMIVATDNNPSAVKHELEGLIATDEETGEPTATPISLTIEGVNEAVSVYPMTDAAKQELKISGDIDLKEFAIDENGKVYYHAGIILYPKDEALKDRTYVTADLYTSTALENAISVTKY